MGEADQLSPDDIVYRRIPAKCGWVQDGEVDPAAFLPNQFDTEGGVSLSWVNTAIEAAATGKMGKKFYAVSLRVGDMQDKGLVIMSDAPHHAYIDGWVFERRDDLEGLAEFLCTICGQPEGPFDGNS